MSAGITGCDITSSLGVPHPHPQTAVPYGCETSVSQLDISLSSHSSLTSNSRAIPRPVFIDSKPALALGGGLCSTRTALCLGLHHYQLQCRPGRTPETVQTSKLLDTGTTQLCISCHQHCSKIRQYSVEADSIC
jgi:hypothetical protein